MNNTPEFDVIIIGGGPAGSSAATYLRKAGYKVLVLEKEKFPRDHVGESLIPFCYYRLSDMGVIDQVRTFATKKPGINFVSKDGKKESVWCFERVLTDGAGMTFHTRRDIFDKTLLDHSASLGAVVKEEYTVTHVALDNTEEVFVSALDQQGHAQTFRARFLLDASGQHSFLAKKLNDKNSYKGLDRVAFFRRWMNNRYDKALNSGLIKIIYLGGEKKGWLWVIPVGRNHLSVGVSLNNDYVKEKKKTLSGENWKDELYLSEIFEAAALKEILKDSVPEFDTRTTGDYSYFAKRKYGDNWAMIGDAGAFLDPIFSSGLYVAMETAYRITKALDVKFKSGNEAGQKEFEAASKDIEGAYQLIEKFVRLFYDPDKLDFSSVRMDETGFTKFLSAYNVFHYLLAGDFFAHHEKYSAFIDSINTETKYEQFLNYVKKQTNPLPNDRYCNYSFEEIYGHLPKE